MEKKRFGRKKYDICNKEFLSCSLLYVIWERDAHVDDSNVIRRDDGDERTNVKHVFNMMKWIRFNVLLHLQHVIFSVLLLVIVVLYNRRC